MATPRLRLVKPTDSGAIVVQPQTRTRSKWTPSLIKSTEVSADNGDMRLVGELCEWLLGDEQISRALHQRAQALLAREPTFEQSGDKRKSGRVVRALEAGEDWWDGWPESQLTQLIVWGILAGFSVARHAWEAVPGHGGRLLPLPAIWDIQHTRYDFNARTWIARVVTGQNTIGVGTEVAFEGGDATWILHTPHGPDKPWRRGLWRGLARFRLLRDYAVSDLARLGEGVSRNVIEADKEVEQGKDVRQELATDLAKMGRDGTIVLPPGLHYKLVEMGTGAVQVFDKQFEISERAINISIRGGNLTTNVDQSGSRAAAEVQERLGDQANLEFDAQSLTTTIHDQSLVHWAEFNFGSGDLAPWPVYPVQPEEDLKAKVEGEEKAFTVVAEAERLGFDVDREAFLEEHKITWAKPGKAPPAPPPAPAPAGATGAPPPAPAPQPAPPPNAKAKQIASLLGLDFNGPRATSDLVQLVKTLTSGARAEANQGFLDGQTYTDAATEWAARRGTETIGPDLETLSGMIAESTSYDDLRAKLEQFLGEDFDPDELGELTHRAMVLAELAGQLAVRKDVPEIQS